MGPQSSTITLHDIRSCIDRTFVLFLSHLWTPFKNWQLGDRVSINLEAPNADRLSHLAPQKQFNDQLLAPFKWFDEFRSTLPPNLAWDGRWPSSTIKKSAVTYLHSRCNRHA